LAHGSADSQDHDQPEGRAVKLSPIQLAVLVVALAVVALGAPYWHVEEKKTLVAATYRRPTRDSALSAINAIEVYDTASCRYITEVRENGVDWSLSIGGSSTLSGGVTMYYVGLLYALEDVTVLDVAFGGSKILYAVAFMLGVLSLVLGDAGRLGAAGP